MDNNDSAVAFLEHVVTNLVDNPDSVKVNKTVDEMGVLLTLDVHPEDMGKIIGRKGATAKAIRTLLRVVGMKNNARVNMKILEPEGGMRSQESAPAPDAAPVEDASSVTADMDAAINDIKEDL
jgi:predicted RNA-binding protein YlqC (UPF0109 family)